MNAAIIFPSDGISHNTGPAGTAAAGPMLEAKLMNLIKGRLQKFWLSNNFSVKFTCSCAPAASPDQSWYASDATVYVKMEKDKVFGYNCHSRN